ncbi:MAG TPA: thioredoxin [Chthoniobacterales bacterium]|nr:thioredoxin [Chthoniobacterales bacterium]
MAQITHARTAFTLRSLGVNATEPDERGLLMTCTNCGKRNRLKYEALGKTFHCGECKNELQPPGEPIDIKSGMVFDALTSRSAFPVLVDFWASWCGPCKMVAPEFVKLARATAGKFLIAKVNTEVVPRLSQRFRITAIPTIVVFNQGSEKARQAGAMPAPAIRDFMEKALGGN